MISRLRPFFGIDDIKAALRASSDSMPELETALAKKLGFKHSLLLSLGRTAIYLFLKDLEKSNNNAIVSVYNCRVVPATVLFAGYSPKYVDSPATGFNVTCNNVAQAVDEKTAAIILTAMYGYPFSREEIKALKAAHPNIPLLGDCALSIFSRSEDYYFADDMDLCFFAFGIGKQVSIVEGGLLTTNNTELYERLRRSRDSLIEAAPFSTKLKRLLLFFGSTLLFHSRLYAALRFLSEETSMLASMKGSGTAVEELMPKDWRYLPSLFQCGIGLNQLRKFDDNNARRMAICERYFSDLDSCQSERFRLPPYYRSLSHFPVLSSKRDELQQHLLRDGIHSTNVFRELPWDLPLVRESCKGDFPNARRLRDQCTLLPLYAQLSDDEVSRVIKSVKRWATG